MPTATVSFPTLLRRFTDGASTIEVEADDVRGALDAACERHPALRVHLFDEAATLRRHVLCFVDGEPTRLDERVPLTAPADVRILQSVAGGAECLRG